jgi:hypothetical protein
MSQFDNLKDQAAQQMQGERAEELSDQGLDRASDLAGDRLGEEHADQVDKARDAADQRIGTGDDAGAQESAGS